MNVLCLSAIPVPNTRCLAFVSNPINTYKIGGFIDDETGLDR